MEYNKVLFIGLGGAGQRHLRVISKLSPNSIYLAFRTTNKTPLLRANFTVDQDNSIKDSYSLRIVETFEKGLLERPELVVISTPTSLHMNFALKAVRSGANVLVEKPFSHNLEQFSELKIAALENNVQVLTSFQRRFNPNFQTIKQYLNENKIGKITAVVFNVSSYLPDWHRYEDFRNMYASKTELGGGVLLTEIHEVDLCFWFFGLPKSVFCMGGSFSDGDLPVEDTVTMILDYQNFIVTLNISFMQKKTRREMYLYGSKTSFEWQETRNQLKIIDHTTGLEEAREVEFSSPDELFEIQYKSLKSSKKNFTEEAFTIAWASIAIVEAAKKSLQTKATVDIDSLIKSLI